MSPALRAAIKHLSAKRGAGGRWTYFCKESQAFFSVSERGLRSLGEALLIGCPPSDQAKLVYFDIVRRHRKRLYGAREAGLL